MQNADVLRPAASPVPTEVDEVDLVPVRTYWQLVRQRFLRHRLAVIALVTLSILIVMSIVVPLVDGRRLDQKSSLPLIDAGPTLSAPLGYNEIGQNIFLRLMKATQTSLIIGFAAVIIIGVDRQPGRLGGRLHGRPGRQPADAHGRRHPVAAVPVPDPADRELLRHPRHPRHRHRASASSAGRPPPASCARSSCSMRESDYAQAAKALGAGHRRLITRHLLPGALAPLVVACALGVADSVITESALSVLGFGIAPPEVSLGQMLRQLQRVLLRATRSASSTRASCSSRSSSARASSATACATRSTRGSESKASPSSRSRAHMEAGTPP